MAPRLAADETKNGETGLKRLTRSDVEKHNQRDDRWLVIDSKVYDVTRWGNKHPGGSKLLSYFAGQDATEPFLAFHAANISYAKKFLRPLLVGEVVDERTKGAELVRDFEQLRMTVDKMGLFKPSYLFFMVVFMHISAAYIGAFLVLHKFGSGLIPSIASILLMTTAQAQINWFQHDIGHLSIFKRGFLKKCIHLLVFGGMKGVSPSWWNHMHFQHHSKPNIIGKDPDVRLEHLFVVGDVMPVEIAKKATTSGGMPYNWQHRYFLVVGPPLLFPVYFQFMTFYHAITRRLWLELAVMSTFYLHYVYYFSLHYGIIGGVMYLFIVRVLESHWFTWVSQSNHIPMDIKYEDNSPWVKQQIEATCNVKQSYFNDWFTGHLNFQAEHHLFPTMPRHNLYKAAPLVKSLCEKHGVSYQVKSLSGAFGDIVRSLKVSGDLWKHAYEELHPDSNE